jgi:MarR family transcriptional regulator, transcriptional regulator for hemolysin
MQTSLPPAKWLGFLVHDVGRLLRREIDQRAQALGLTSAQWRLLSAVARTELLNQEPLNQVSLAEQLEIEPITVSRLIDRMEAAKLIERRPDPADRRAYRLFVTDSARPLLADFRAVAYECVNAALAGVGEDEIEMVVDVLTRVRANLVGRPNETSPTISPAKASPAKVKMKADSLA